MFDLLVTKESNNMRKFLVLFSFVLAVLILPEQSQAGGGTTPANPLEQILWWTHIPCDIFGAGCQEVCETVFPTPDENGWPTWDVPFVGEDIGGGNEVVKVVKGYWYEIWN